MSYIISSILILRGVSSDGLVTETTSFNSFLVWGNAGKITSEVMESKDEYMSTGTEINKLAEAITKGVVGGLKP
jgi:hypothetical protein